MNQQSADYYIEKLRLKAHPEGGYYRETYRSAEMIYQEHLPRRFSGDRNFSTAIYFLMKQGHFSAFHRIQADEMWHFYAGDPMHLYIIFPNGSLDHYLIGDDLEKGQTFQAVVKGGCWFASEPAEDSAYSLVGCTVAPGFEFEDFEMAKADDLIRQFPTHAALIKRLTRF